ncbi:hypothetical protein [Hazenella coriacea]|nr:hypothetical protein [Hazenella coriacea]
MKSKINRLLIGLFVTLFISFGGFYLYQWLWIEQPITSMLENQSNIHNDFQVKVTPSKVEVQLHPKKDFSLQQQYSLLMKQIEEKIGDRPIRIELSTPSDHLLEKAWSEMTFGVKEGISLQTYTQIPTTVSNIAEKYEIQQRVSMDDQFVYIELRKENKYLFKVLPLQEQKERVVKSNE